MPREEFERLVAEEFPTAVPEDFKDKIKNVAFLIEDEPSHELRREEGLSLNETLLGHYRGIPHTARGDFYGMGATMPDSITLFQLPILELAYEMGGSDAAVRQVIRDTIWHELAHHFGMDESAVRRREAERQNDIPKI
jgi:predicted Zn-dependent protease with MMP-like domain